jgi:hypothetical protein
MNAIQESANGRVHIPNIDPFRLSDSKKLSRSSNSKFLVDCGIRAVYLILYIFFPIYAFSSTLDQTRFKLYCMHTPKFKTLYEQYFLPSIKDDFEVVAREYEQECPSGIYKSVGWKQTMLRKLELLREAVEEHWNDRLFFYSDVDIIFLQPILEIALNCLGDRDFVVQQGWPRNLLCAGFFVMRSNEKTLKLIEIAMDLLEKGNCPDDQAAIQTALHQFKQGEIAWGFLPSLQFPNGRRVLKKTRRGNRDLYSLDSEIILDDSIVLFHANCCIGLENKYHFLDRVQEQYFKLKERI